MLGEWKGKSDVDVHQRTAAFLVCILLIAGLWVGSPVYGQVSDPARQSSLSLSPLLIELQGMPGRTVNFDVYLANTSGHRSSSFQVSTVPVTTKENGQYQLLFEKDYAYSASDWITVEEDRFTLAPGEARLVVGDIHIPRNAQGGRYAAVVFTLVDDEESDPESGASAVVNYQVATIIELTIGQRFVKRGHISELSVIPGSEVRSVMPLPPNSLLFTGTFVNESNVHVFVNGSLIIRDDRGRRINQIPLGTGRGAVYPGASLQLGSVLSRGLPPGEYELQAVINYGGLRPAMARTTVTVGTEGAQKKKMMGGPNIPLDVSTGEMNVTAPPKALRNRSVTVQNLHDTPVKVRAKLQPMMYDSQGFLDVARMEEAGALSVPWINITPEEFTLNPNQRRNIRVSVRDPGLEPQAYYYYILLEADEYDRETGDMTADGQKGEAGIGLMIFPDEELPRKAIINEMVIESTGPDEETGYEMFRLFVNIENVGPIHIDGSGTVSLWQKMMPEALDGAEFQSEGIFIPVTSDALPPDLIENILPGEHRELLVGLPPELDAGEYRLGLDIRYGGEAPLSHFIDFVVEGTDLGEMDGQQFHQGEGE